MVPSYPGMLSNMLAGGALGPSAVGGANMAERQPEEPVESNPETPSNVTVQKLTIKWTEKTKQKKKQLNHRANQRISTESL